MKKNKTEIKSLKITVRGILIALILCLLPAFAAATEIDKAPERPDRPIPNGHKHVDIEIYHGPGGMEAQEAYASYPAKYDSRTQSWYQGFQVNDQGNTNLCWACAASEAAQLSYAKETAGAQRTRTSPPQLGYFFYNRISDPLGNTGGDSNESWFGDWVEEGGNAVNTFQHMATWSGLISYNDAPMTLDENDDYIGLGEWWWNPEGEPFPNELAFDRNIITEQNTIFYDKLNYRSETDRNVVKSLLMKYGAVHVSMDFQDIYYADGDSGGVAYYHPDPFSKNNHEVVIVGWDDTYPVENFNSATKKRSWDFHKQPKQPGAWIVLNSWGDSYHDGGYFYASYESTDILADGICTYDMQAPSEYKYNFQYDGNAYQGNDAIIKGEKAANIFTAPFDQQIRLDAVGMTEWNDADTDYQIQVYTGLTSPNDPESGALACTMNASTDSPGYKTIKLTQPVVVDAGETYSIVITFLSEKTLMGYESEYDGSKGTYYAFIDQGQSYYYNPKVNWFDVDALDMCFRIKGLANQTACSHNDQILETVEPTADTDGYTLHGCTRCGHAYKSDLTLRFNPTPNPVTLFKAKAGRKCFTAIWILQTQRLAGNNINGYQIRWSTKKSMSGAKKTSVGSYLKDRKKITRLASKKKYYVQMRAYFVSPADGRTYYSKWSNKLAVKTK